MKLKTQLKETHQELEDTRKELDKRTQASDEFQQEVWHEYVRTNQLKKQDFDN